MSKIMFASNVPFHAHHCSSCVPYSGAENKVLAYKLAPMSTNSNESTSEIMFLQEKQDELLRQLHQEIHQLKTENSELKFQLYAILKAKQNNNPELKSESEVKTVVVEKEKAREDCMQIGGNNGGIEVRKNDNTGSGNQSYLTGPDQTHHDDANQLQPSDNASIGLEKKGTRFAYKNETMISVSPKRVGTGIRDREPEKPKVNTKGSPVKIKIKAGIDDKIPGEFDSVEKVGNFVNKQEKDRHTSRASIPNSTTSANYGLPLSLVPRSSSASARRVQTLRHNSLSVLPSNYKDNVATLPPLVLNNSDRKTAAKLAQIKPWSISPHVQKYNPSTMTKQKSIGTSTTSPSRQPLNSEKQLK